MRENYIIIVTGAPGSGKTTLAKKIYRKFNIPMIGRNDIKEQLFNSVRAINKIGKLKGKNKF